VKGSYILLIALPEQQTITIGSLKANKRPHWHIDYFLEKASIDEIILCQTEGKAECTIAQALSHQFDCIPGFGSSDCQCKSHLFFATEEAQMKSNIMAILSSVGMPPRLKEALR